MNKDIIWIVAGNANEFHSYVRRKMSLGHNPNNFKFVYSVSTLRGLNNIKGFYIGNYKSRSDIDEIILAIQIRKSYEIPIGVVDRIT